MRGQFSFEYLLVVGFALVIILPITYYAYVSLQESKTEVSLAAVDKIGFDIVNTAKNVHNLGQLSRITLELNFPDGVDGMAAYSDPVNLKLHYLEIDVQGSELLFASDVMLRGEFSPEDYSQGIKNVRIENIGPYVNISIT
ncbi:hypothetical protein KY337_03955 [Candidatus Woesearchaeota archaeon]|nr:hypothetical protein [Candidatus Woesearchaeota archaeon]